ncbi:Hypothetical predicted protein [Marmota monax]|uniref:26S proteasome non-ATPase regulatory subunit 2 n=1 Tax=Marmota monax TaxID=9995 RepID=A0A5E4B424_MARMO|nr:26S proteasome non-ATPase regulatory subunit 2 [Marmota monax]VTJ64364.1 Hypothetical predicted protein [Marmota monax]
MEEGGKDKAPVQPQQPPATAPGSADEKSSGKERRDAGDKDKEQELSEEDKQLQDELEMLVERLGEKDTSLYRPALEELRRQIRSSTTSMTSVPKPLKFLRPHYGKLKEIYENMAPGENKRFAADIISVLAMTMSGERECLKYRLVGSQEELASWGHEYVRHLAGEVAKEWQELDDAEKVQREPLLTLVKEIVPYNMAHNAEHEACDLLMEIEQVDMLEKDIDENAYAKVCLYLTSCVNYVPEPENSALLRCALGVFRKFSRFPEALRLALMLNDMELVEDIFTSCKDVVVQKQMAFMLGRHGVFLELSEDVEEYEDLTEIMSNVQLNSNFLALARELDIMEPKVPDDIYKTHLENNRFGGSGSQVDSARMNLASSFVNGFVNAAFGQDKLLTDDGNKWLYKNKDHGMLSAAASLGMILLWDVDGGLTQIDKYLYSSEDYIKSGALLACGIVNSGVRNECDPALALLSDYVLHNSNTMRLGSIFGLGLAYAGSNREDVLTLLLPVMGDSKSSMELRYGEPTLRRAVPLALALISVSNPRLNILDTLSKFSHDADPEVSYNSIFAMGMVGSGTNNARLAAMLRQLAQYHAKDPNNLFMVRLAQGLTHLGKGTLTLCPYHSDRQLMSQVAVAGLLTVLVSFLDVRNIILGKSHYVLYGLVAAMQPRMLVTFDEELRPLPVSVRVGQAVDVVGQAGKPKTITGFQTHTTPVLLAHGERAELATEEFLPVTPILEGFVILRKNPNYDL